MNSKVIGIIIAIVVIAGAAFYFTRGTNDTNVASENESVESSAQVSTESTSLKSLMAGGKNQKCTFASKETDAETSGTVYVASGKVRGDFTVKSAGTTMASHMINMDNTSYLWTDGSNSGFKMTIDAETQANANTQAQSQGVDQNKNFDFSCERWSPDNSKFDLPDGVSFSEMPTIPNLNLNMNANTSTTTPDTKAMQQAICNNLPEPAKSQCLAGIK